MAVYRYPPEVHELVKKYAPVMRDQELAEKCNQELGTQFTANKMKQFRGNGKKGAVVRGSGAVRDCVGHGEAADRGKQDQGKEKK